MLTLNRPALIESCELRLAREYSSVRWAHHRLLDFDAEHQRVLDAAADETAPGIVRIGRIVARLARRSRRAERTTEGSWCPNPRPDLAARLRTKLGELRKIRNADPRWKAALGWSDEPVGEAKQVRRRRAKSPNKVKRRKTETDEAFRKRFDLMTRDETDEHYAEKVSAAHRDTRRDVHRKGLFAQRRFYWGTWNALLRSVDQARRDVLKLRRSGLPAEMRRPKYRDPVSLCADAGGFRIIERGPLWWVIELRLGVSEEWVRLRAKCGNWHRVPGDAKISTAKLTRRKDGERWSYSVSLTIEMDKATLERATTGMVSFDWGHREHGHDQWRDGIRVFTWVGDDGQCGEVLIPAECRLALDQIDGLKKRMDAAFEARKKSRGLPDRNRYTYRRKLMRSGVRSEEEATWLRWEMRYERRISKRRWRVQSLRRETYTRAIRELRSRYAVFAFEDESIKSIQRKQKDQQARRRQRSNRDLATRYEFVSLCERFGAEIITVTARNSTRECPECGGLLDKNGPELVVVCPHCGTSRDKDQGAARVIMSRAKEALASRAA